MRQAHAGERGQEHEQRQLQRRVRSDHGAGPAGEGLHHAVGLPRVLRLHNVQRGDLAAQPKPLGFPGELGEAFAAAGQVPCSERFAAVQVVAGTVLRHDAGGGRSVLDEFFRNAVPLQIHGRHRAGQDRVHQQDRGEDRRTQGAAAPAAPAGRCCCGQHRGQQALAVRSVSRVPHLHGEDQAAVGAHAAERQVAAADNGLVGQEHVPRSRRGARLVLPPGADALFRQEAGGLAPGVPGRRHRLCHHPARGRHDATGARVGLQSLCHRQHRAPRAAIAARVGPAGPLGVEPGRLLRRLRVPVRGRHAAAAPG